MGRSAHVLVAPSKTIRPSAESGPCHDAGTSLETNSPQPLEQRVSGGKHPHSQDVPFHLRRLSYADISGLLPAQQDTYLLELSKAQAKFLSLQRGILAQSYTQLMYGTWFRLIFPQCTVTRHSSRVYTCLSHLEDQGFRLQTPVPDQVGGPKSGGDIGGF